MIPYFNIDIKITIEAKKRLELLMVNSIRIENTVEKLSDTATIEMPKAVEFGHADWKGVLKYFQVGDPITIEVGYNGKLNKEFEGYITKISAELPIKIECEDEMWKLKRMPKVNKTFSKVSLKELVQFLLPTYQFETSLETTIGKYMIENATPYEVLEDLKKYFIRFFFVGKVLHSDLMVNLKPLQRHQFNLNRNVRQSDNLLFETKEKEKAWVKAISRQSKTSQEVVYEFGEKGQNEIQLDCPPDLTKEELKIWAEDCYKRKAHDGYTGSFSSWGIPKTNAGDSAYLKDPNNSDGHRDGNFFISEVITDINGSDGFKRTNTITHKL